MGAGVLRLPFAVCCGGSLPPGGGEPLAVPTDPVASPVDAHIGVWPSQGMPVAARRHRLLRHSARRLPVLRAQAAGDVGVAAPLHGADVVRGAPSSGPLTADVLSVRDRLEMRGVHATSVRAWGASRAVLRVMANVVKDQPLGDLADFVPVGDAVRRGVKPGAVALDGQRAQPQPASVRASRLVDQAPEVRLRIVRVGELSTGEVECASRVHAHVVAAAETSADRPVCAVINAARPVGGLSGANDQGITSALPADVVLVAPAARDGGSGTGRSVLDDGTGSVGHGRTPSAARVGRGRRRVERRRPTLPVQRATSACRFRPAGVN